MLEMFEKTYYLKVQSGRRRKPVPQNAIEEVATATVEKALDNITGTYNVRRLARNLHIPYCTVWKILRKFIHFYP